MPSLLALIPAFLALASALTPGPNPEVHPKLTTWKCTKAGGCKEQTSLLVLDQLAHPVYQVNNPSLGCGAKGPPPNVSVCPDEATCAKNCIVDGIPDYEKYGVKTSGDLLTMHQLDKEGVKVTPRVYLLNEEGDKYDMLKLSGNELSFDVDSSKLPCGMNSALYLSEMDEQGGKSELNPTGARYGGGYCDAQCYTTPFVNGVGNIKGKGVCCNEMDIWEANAVATAFAPHACNQTGLYQCTGAECADDGVCDKDGCSYNTYVQGNKDFYGRGLTVDTNRPFTVVTQFPEVDGVMTEIRRLYIQDGKVIQNAAIKTTANVTGNNFLNDKDFCGKPGAAERYMDLGGTPVMGKALERGMVLIFSIWWDPTGFMNWLDSGNAGPCNATEGDPKQIIKVVSSPVVTWSKVKWGEIGSTYKGSA
ncbi:related to Endoglucanase 1 [Rhynchosporium graminicola]|uniref:Glucanase n=1 Tax=Rhynchosporium graminicola TaxID=2792576 RepID=A0A1E1LQF8_9HELO|nr:related to Endoglucanase 1 [Rhynchosporium commune]